MIDCSGIEGAVASRAQAHASCRDDVALQECEQLRLRQVLERPPGVWRSATELAFLAGARTERKVAFRTAPRHAIDYNVYTHQVGRNNTAVEHVVICGV